MIIHPDNNPARTLIQNATGSLHLHDKHLHDKHLREAQLPGEIALPSGKVVRKPAGF